MFSNWFLIALAAPLFWSFINYIDKLLLSKYPEGKGVGAIMLFSSLFSITILPIIGYFNRSTLLNLPLFDLFLLIIVGLLSASATYFYLRAMNIEDPSIVVPLLQLIPIFAYFLGFLILGESLSIQQILFSLLILLGIALISIEIDTENKIKFKIKALFWVSLSSFLFALHDVIFKMVAIQDTFWVSAFWQYTGLSLFGFFSLLISTHAREEFFKIFKGKNWTNLSLNITSEILYILGNLANNFATLLAPVALVLVVASYQPLFVFIEGVLLTVFLPKIITEKISIKHLVQKLISIIIIIVGSYLLYTASPH
jgi:uncharacterized membrane protein